MGGSESGKASLKVTGEQRADEVWESSLGLSQQRAFQGEGTARAES